MATTMFDLTAIEAETQTATVGAGRIGWREARALLLGCSDADRREWPIVLHRGGVRSRLLGSLLALIGVDPPRPLASERLEAVRRYAYLARKADRHAPELLTGLRRHGFSTGQLAEIQAIVGR